MEIPFVHVCDYAIVSQDGKLSVMGIFGVINAPKMPVVHPQLFLAFELSFDYAEIGRDFKYEIQIVDEDGRKIWGIEAGGAIQTQTPPKPGERPSVGQIVAIQNLRFDKFGSYDVNIFTNGKHAKRAQLRLNRLVIPQPS